MISAGQYRSNLGATLFLSAYAKKSGRHVTLGAHAGNYGFIGVFPTCFLNNGREPMISSPMIEASTSQIGNLLQFLAWVADRPRTYAETMEAWRTSCPRLSAWEDATTDGLVDIGHEQDAAHGEVAVVLTEKGAALLKTVQESLTPKTTNNHSPNSVQRASIVDVAE